MTTQSATKLSSNISLLEKIALTGTQNYQIWKMILKMNLNAKTSSSVSET